MKNTALCRYVMSFVFCLCAGTLYAAANVPAFQIDTVLTQWTFEV